MASVNWDKATIQKAGFMINHNGKKERVEKNHSNTDINKSKSHLNFYIGADDYAPMLQKAKARIKAVDEKYPPKKNLGAKRITFIMLETPVPKAIEEQGRAKEFLMETHKVIEAFFGAENVGGTVCHFDEQHPYTDSKTNLEKVSLIHAHTLCCAYAEWTEKKTNKKTGKTIVEERKGINGKHCETREKLHALNDKMQEMCLAKFGVSFNTGETPQKKSVERLKNESALKEEENKLKKKVAELKAEAVELQPLAEKSRDLKKEVSKFKKKKEENQAEVEELQEKIMQYEPPKKNLMESNKAYEERSKTYQELQLIKEKEISQQRLQAELTAREQAVHQREVECERKKKALEEELQQAYEKGYAVGYETGKERGRAEQPKEDKAKIAELERTIAYKNKILQEIDDDVISLGYENYEDMIADIQERQEQEEEIEYE